MSNKQTSRFVKHKYKNKRKQEANVRTQASNKKG